MHKLLVALVLGAFVLTGCNTAIGAKAAEGHYKVFGCWPQGYTPPPAPERSLNAEDGVKRDFMGNECGKPAYKKPKCAEQTPECQDGNCALPPVKLAPLK